MNFLKSAIMSCLLLLGGCTTLGDRLSPGEGSASYISGPDITNNNTPSTVGLLCVGNKIKTESTGVRYRIAVGEIDDVTGLGSRYESSIITGGGPLMVTSALGKLGVVDIVERIDTSVFMFNQELIEKDLMLGLPSKSVTLSDYYITGGVTEANFNIRTVGGGAVTSGDPNGFSINARQYVMNIAVDLRLVDTKTLSVVKSVSLQKQMVGYETSGGVFRFFGAKLIDLNIENKIDEPVHLGIRSILEHGVAELIGSLYYVNVMSVIAPLKTHNITDEWIRNPQTIANRLCS